MRAAKLQPRQIPPEIESAVTNGYPNYTWGNEAPWPVKYTPACLDMVTFDPDAPKGVYEKVLLKETCQVQQSCGSLTNWTTLFKWQFWDVAAYPKSSGGLPVVNAFRPFSNEFAVFQMKTNYGGFDIQPTDMLRSCVNTSIFWRVVE